MKIHKYTIQSAIAGNLLLLILLNGCNSAVSPTAFITSPASPETTVSKQTLEAPSTPTLLPTNLPAITQTSTPIPTLSSAEAQSAIMELLENNAGCQFPCWWGFVPGETTWLDVKRTVAPFASQMLDPESSKNPYSVGVLQFIVPKEVFETTLHHDYTIQNGVVQAIEVDVGNIEKYRIDKLLNIYGKPSEVWIATWSQSRENDLPFETVLFYADRKIIMRFVSQARQINNSILGCPQQRPVGTLFFWSDQDNLGFLDITNQTRDIKYYEGDRPYTLLQDVTQMSLDEFYAIFSNPNNTTCIETSTAFWVSPSP